MDIFVLPSNCKGGRLVSGVAGQFSIVQLFNPVNSGVVLTVTSWRITPGAATFMDLRTHNVALGIPVVSVGSQIVGDTSYTIQGKLNVLNQATTPGNLYSIVGSASTVGVEALADPIAILPGFGLHSNPLSHNVSLAVSAEWAESTVLDNSAHATSHISCTFAQFVEICLDASGIAYGGAVVYVGNPVVNASLLNTARLGVLFTLIDAPSESTFLTAFPTAIKVSSLN